MAEGDTILRGRRTHAAGRPGSNGSTGAACRRGGRPCPRCRTPIASRGQGDDNRTTYWCPRCQAG